MCWKPSVIMFGNMSTEHFLFSTIILFLTCPSIHFYICCSWTHMHMHPFPHLNRLLGMIANRSSGTLASLQRLWMATEAIIHITGLEFLATFGILCTFASRFHNCIIAALTMPYATGYLLHTSCCDMSHVLVNRHVFRNKFNHASVSFNKGELCSLVMCSIC